MQAFDNSYYDRERRVRRCFGEVIIICYQMTTLLRRALWNRLSPYVRGQSQMFFLRRPRTEKVGLHPKGWNVFNECFGRVKLSRLELLLSVQLINEKMVLAPIKLIIESLNSRRFDEDEGLGSVLFFLLSRGSRLRLAAVVGEENGLWVGGIFYGEGWSPGSGRLGHVA